MKTASLLQNVEFGDSKPKFSLLLETEVLKEIRIAFKEQQLLKEHEAPFPIVVYVATGEIDFGVFGQTITLKTGDMIALEANVPHNLKALKESVIKLTLSKQDHLERVEKVVEG
tara:strand:+ start:224 stop:565 length:342 start_codon:yes stop_codon:yes gene_type:complete